MSMKIGVVKNSIKNIAGKQMLNHDSAYVGQRNFGVDLRLAQFQKFISYRNKTRVCFSGSFDLCTQRFDDFWYVCLKIIKRFLKFVDRCVFKRYKSCD